MQLPGVRSVHSGPNSTLLLPISPVLICRAVLLLRLQRTQGHAGSATKVRLCGKASGWTARKLHKTWRWLLHLRGYNRKESSCTSIQLHWVIRARKNVKNALTSACKRASLEDGKPCVSFPSLKGSLACVGAADGAADAGTEVIHGGQGPGGGG
jgi:hypothetical protein